MNSGRLVSMAWQALGRYKLRSFFMMLGSLVGVTALTLVVSIGSGAKQKMADTVGKLFNASTIMITSGSGMILSGPRGDGARLTLDDIRALESELPAVEAWDPIQVIAPAQVRHRAADSSPRVLGVSERSEHVWARSVVRGEFFDVAAVARSDRVAVIGATVARELFAGEDPVGAELLIGQVPFRVIGLLEPFGTDLHGMDRDNEILVPISTMMRRLLNVDSIRGAKLLVRSPAQLSETARECKRILRERHGLAAGQPDDFTIMTTLEVQGMMAKSERIFSLFVPLAACLAVLAGGVVSAIVMLFSVRERTAEIGLRRALGARARDIASQFLLESAVITCVGGVLGILAGTALAVLLGTRLGLPEFLSFKAVAAGLAISSVTGLGFGVIPARRAAMLVPHEALRR
ncbi:MAG: ABC transporter permease [Deltaproteobacteria bacterium]|nr:ABC transporter permease [Deltaproteobacteria bacterium]